MLQITPVDIVDGQSIFWRNGTRIVLGEVLHWLSMQTINDGGNTKG